MEKIVYYDPTSDSETDIDSMEELIKIANRVKREKKYGAKFFYTDQASDKNELVSRFVEFLKEQPMRDKSIRDGFRLMQVKLYSYEGQIETPKRQCHPTFLTEPIKQYKYAFKSPRAPIQRLKDEYWRFVYHSV